MNIKLNMEAKYLEKDFSRFEKLTIQITSYLEFNYKEGK